MSKVRFSISISLDGYVAGPNQSVQDPLGGEQLHQWATSELQESAAGLGGRFLC
jgi:hypothetical protein